MQKITQKLKETIPDILDGVSCTADNKTKAEQFDCYFESAFPLPLEAVAGF